MNKMIRGLMAMCFLAVSLTAFAQSGDAMKQDSMKQDDSMTQDDSMKQGDSMKKDDNMKHDDSMKQN